MISPWWGLVWIIVFLGVIPTILCYDKVLPKKWVDAINKRIMK